MQYYEKRAEQKPLSAGGKIIAFIARLALAIIIPLIAFYVLYQGFLFLRGGDAPKGVITIVAIIWGVGGVALLYWIFNWLVEHAARGLDRPPAALRFCRPGYRDPDLVSGAAHRAHTSGSAFLVANGPPAVTLRMLFTNPGEYLQLDRGQYCRPGQLCSGLHRPRDA